MNNQELEYRVLKLLDENPKITQREMASALGVSLGKTHYVLRACIELGWVKLDNFRKSDSKWGCAYLLTPEGVWERGQLTRKFLLIKQLEYNALKNEIRDLMEEMKELK